MIRKQIEKILYNVEKPARYVGGELNSIIKTDKTLTRFCMAFPDTYEVGMSHLGSKIIYGLINKRQDSACERAFAPWIDMEAQMRQNNILLYGHETFTPLKDFDIIGFTLQYEMSYTNILNMLDLSKIEIEQKKRTTGPFVMVGGPCACNVEPIAEMIDFAIIGDGEDTINIMLDEYNQWKTSGESRDDFLRRVSKYQGFYVPKFYTPNYNDDKTTKSYSRDEFFPEKISRAIVPNLDEAYYPTDVTVPFVEAVHDRMMLELFRGCTRGCRFCQAGFLYRPMRLRKKETLLRQAIELEKYTGMEEISLTSLSTGDYPCLGDLIADLTKEFEQKRVSLALPSLRLDSFAKDYAQNTTNVRKTALTFAPEAGSQRLRDVINKGITQEDLVRSLKSAFESGWNRVKLYFMIGLPTETYEDLDAMVELAAVVARTYYSVDKAVRAKGLKITVSASTFVPKPFTPFQWAPQDTIEEICKKQEYLREKFKGSRSVDFKYHSPKTSHLEAIFARGDRTLFPVLKTAFELGCRFDGWSECFDFELWKKAFEKCDIDRAFFANRQRNKEEIFPYENIDMVVTKEYLWKELEAANQTQSTQDCTKGCNGCFGEQDYENYCTI